MRIPLKEAERNGATVTLSTVLPASSQAAVARYETQTGALLRIDGRVEAAFDREHGEVELTPASRERTITLEVEKHSLPTNLLPSGPGLWWRWISWRANARPARAIKLEPKKQTDATAVSPAPEALPLWGHSHLDVAWLWTYDETKRKAMRTFANAIQLLESDPSFVFMQSQPQLYDFVREQDREFFERVADAARGGRFDPDVAAMWVEPDCNIPSGESLLRQMLAAHRFCLEWFAIEPSIAWLPDTFGFARTLPTLLAHAGIRYFATTKLQWNDTTRFAYPQFRWRGPDGAEIVSALIDRMEGGCGPLRVRLARQRSEPLVIGYGDGGGGPTRKQLADARDTGRWERPRKWFERVESRRDELPVHDDELYLEYHRGVYTTHHDVKAQNASLERRLADVEERAAWCIAIKVPADALKNVRAALRDAWQFVLRNQFHDVLPGTAVSEVYDDARQEYERAHEIVDAAAAATQSMLPRAAREPAEAACRAPAERDGAYVFENRWLKARVLPTGTIVELAARDGAQNVVAQANLLALYRDRPKRWEAWNVDAGYERSQRAAKPQPPRIERGALEIPFDAGGSRATMRISLTDGEPFLRVDLAIDWRERRRFLRLENWLAMSTDNVLYGAPHGVVERSALADTPERRARFEVPGQRFALVRGSDGRALACLALDTYGWSARALGRGGIHLGHSLLRGTTWPDPAADRGEHQLCWAYAPLRDATIADVERIWLQFAGRSGVRLFESEEPSVLVVACKPAEDGDGAIVRVRECDGSARPFRLRCGGRMREVTPVDALERPYQGEARIEEETLSSTIGAFGLRSFRVRF